MASDQGTVIDITLEAGADLSAGQYRFVTLAADGQVDLTGSAGGTALGVLQNKPDAAGKAAVIRVVGVSKLVAAGTITPDDKLQSDASGDALAAATGDHVLAQALANADDNDVFPAFINCVGAHILA
jgi:hypothetical protein